MSGIKQFLLDVFNFLLNIVRMIIFIIVGNIICFDIIEYSKDAISLFNLFLLIFFSLYLLIQNIFFRSLFYILSKYEFKNKNNKK